MYALNKIHSEASIELLHVSALWCHRQGVIQNKAAQGQQLIYVLCLPYYNDTHRINNRYEEHKI